MTIKPGTPIMVLRDLEYEVPYLWSRNYPVANGPIKMPAGTRLTVIKAKTHRTQPGWMSPEVPLVWVGFSNHKLLVPTDACQVIKETNDDSRQRICEELLDKAKAKVTTHETALKNAREELIQATKVAEVLPQLRPGDFARITLYSYDMVARIEKFERKFIKVSVLASEVWCGTTTQIEADEIIKLEKVPATHLPLFLGWKHQSAIFEKILKGRKSC